MAVSLGVAGATPRTIPTDATSAVPLAATCVDDAIQYAAAQRHSSRVVHSEAATAAGGPGLTLSTRISPDARSGEIVVTGSDSSPDELALAYARDGRSPARDAALAGLSRASIQRLCTRSTSQQNVTASVAATGQIYDHYCATDNVDDVQWEGCVTRYRNTSETDPSYNYGIDESEAWGFEDSNWPWVGLLVGGVRNSYNTSNVNIIQASPGSTISDVSSCRTMGFGVTVPGYGISASGTVCPAFWKVMKTSVNTVPEYHWVEWHGDEHDQREVEAVSGWAVRSGYGTAHSLIINWQTG